MAEANQPEPLGEAVPSITASVSWSGSGVTITLPQVDSADPTGATWDGSSATSNGNRSYSGSTENASNSLVATYSAGTYQNLSIPRNTTRVTLTKT